MPSIAGMCSSIGPTLVSTGLAPSATRALVGVRGVGDAEGHGAGAGAVPRGEAAGEAVGLGVDDEVDVALPVKRHVLRAVLRDRREAQRREQRIELLPARRAYSTNSKPSVPIGLSSEISALGALCG